MIFGVSGISFILFHGFQLHKFGNYLKVHHPTKWGEIKPKKLLGFTQDNIEIRNYFTEIGFIFNSEILSDSKVHSYKIKIRAFLILGILFLLCASLSHLLI